MNKTILYLAVLLTLVSCTNKNEEEPSNVQVNSYLHLSHTRTKSNPKLDRVVEQLNFEKYDMLWLGGDLAQLTSEDDATINHVDSIFNLSSRNTLWSIGNHDYTDLERVRNSTKKPLYYSTHKNGITLVVLDTQDSLSNIIGAQRDFLFRVLDTIQESSHLVVLHHKLIWMYNQIDLEPIISDVSNIKLADCFFCINPNNFNSEIYPRLVEIKESGVEVICIGGDIGFQTREFEYKTDEGIYFLASGIYAGKEGNKVLLFSHELETRKLSWEFIAIRDL
ncbi:MAG: hypothetical protein ACI9DK_002312 [Vicingaceae bacterium]|jgi:hypothetical protein